MVEPFHIALSQFAIREYADSNINAPENENILRYFQEIGFEWVQDDGMAGCSAFVNWCAMKSNKPMSNKLNARSWLTVGKPVSKSKVKLGDVVVLWRGSKTSWKGHVGFYIRESANYVWILGGNQGDEVNIKRYPKYRVLKYRRL